MTSTQIIIDNEKSIKDLIDEQSRIAIEAIVASEELHKQMREQEQIILSQRERIVELESKYRGKAISEGKLRKKVYSLENRLHDQQSVVLERHTQEHKISCYLHPDPKFIGEMKDLYERLERLLVENECYRNYNKEAETRIASLTQELSAAQNAIDERDMQIEYMAKSHEKELKQYEDILTESSTEISCYEETIRELSRKIQVLEGKNQSKQIMYNSFKDKNSNTNNDDNNSIIIEGKEKDLYSGEQKDIILSYIKDRMANLEPNTRQFHICKSILEANKEDGTRESIRRTIFDALKKNYTLSNIPRELKDKLNSIDIEIIKGSSNNPHPKLRFKGDDRYLVSISGTPSDKRSGLNSASNVVRIFL